jgi:hypothetical protein
LSGSTNIRVFQADDFKLVIDFISDIIVNEFKFKLELDTLDSDIIAIDETYNKSNRGCFWVAQTIDHDDYYSIKHQKIVGTAAVRNLRRFESTCELKRMYVLCGFRRLGLGQKLLDTAIAKKHWSFKDGLGQFKDVICNKSTISKEWFC